jgi:hypothetical protein
MEQTLPAILPLLHLVALSMWGGVVATEAVIEIYPFKRLELHPATIRMHYWIDLLVELPLVVAVLASGSALLWAVEDITRLHLVKVGFGSAAVLVNLSCIAVVVRRARRLKDGPESRLWRASRFILLCFAVGLGCAAVAAVLGFRLGLARLG